MNIFALKPKLYIGKNEINNLEHELKSQNFKSIFIVCSNAGFISDALKDTLRIIKKLGIEYFIYQISNSYVEAEEIFEASELFLKKKSSLIIAIGGSTTIDFTKILAIYTPNKSLHHSVWHYVNEPSVLKKGSFPIVAIPLNWANSSCSNNLSFVYNTKMNIAQGVVTYNSLPSVVIADYSYTFTLNNKQRKRTFLFTILNCLNNILDDDSKDWMWTKNYNYSNLISIIKATLLLIKNNENESAWNILISNAFFNGSGLEHYNQHFSYELLSLFLGINGFKHYDFCTLINNLFIPYWRIKGNFNKDFNKKLNILNKKIFNKETSDLNLLTQFLKLNDIFVEEEPLQFSDENIVNKMIENSIIQYQKNYLDILDINTEEYKKMQDETTSLYTKILYSFLKEENR